MSRRNLSERIDRTVGPGRRIGRRAWMLGWTTAVVAVPLRGESPVAVAFRRAAATDGNPIRIGSHRRGVDHAVVTAIAADPRHRLIAVAGDDLAVRIFDVDSMRVVETLTGHRDLIRSLHFDATGDRLASAGNDGDVFVWRRDDWTAEPERHGVGPAIACVRFTTRGERLLAAGFDRRVSLLRCGVESAEGEPEPNREVSGAPSAGVRCRCGDLRAIAPSRDRKRMVVAGRSGEIETFDLGTGRSVGRQSLHDRRIRDIAFRPDGRTLVSVGEDGAVVLYDTELDEKLAEVKVTTGRLFALANVDDRHVAVAGSDNVVRIMDTDPLGVIHTFEGHVGSVTSLAVSQGWLFSGGYDATVRRWPVEPLRSQQRIAEGDPRLER